MIKKQTTNISVFGDSLVYGLDDNNKKRGWVSRLQNKVDEKNKFINFGVCGDTSSDLLERIDQELKRSNPDIVIISIGANDSQYKNLEKNTLVNIENYKKNLEKILNKTKKYSFRIIFVGLPKMNDEITTNWKYLYNFCNSNLNKYDKVMKDFSKKNNLQYIHIFDLLNKEDLIDGAHPNSVGYEKIANKINENLIL